MARHFSENKKLKTNSEKMGLDNMDKKAVVQEVH